MGVPTIELLQAPVRDGNIDLKSFQNLASDICRLLSNYPHYVVVKGYPAVEDSTNLVTLCKAICAICSPQGMQGFGSLEKAKVSFTQVRINPNKAEVKNGVTQYSRTHLPLAPHTDSSYMSQPHELVAFQCIIADDTGGESIMIPVEDVLARLNQTTKERLQAAVYPFRDRYQPILFGNQDNLQIRYYRSQIDCILESGKISLSNEYLEATATLDKVLQETEQFHRFALKPGDIVLMHNCKVLHGRTGFAEDSDRLLYRVRVHLENLALGVSKKETQSNSSKKDHQKEKISPQVKENIISAVKMVQLKRWDEALKHYQLAIELAPNSLEILYDYGKVLLTVGKFNQALEVFRHCLAIDPHDYDSGLAFSSLLHGQGDLEGAKTMLAKVTRKHPYRFVSKPNPQKPSILRMRGLEGSAYSIVEQADGTFKHLLRGGHFSIGDLVDKSQINLTILNIFENNLEELNNLPKFDLILNTIACPDLKPVSLLAAARFVDRYPHIPLINHPRKVLATTRERNSLRLNMIRGVRFPKTEKITWDGISVEKVIQEILGWGFTFPLIVRKVGSQTGSSVAFLKNKSELKSHFQNSPSHQHYYVIQYHDCRYFQDVSNKTRVFFIDGKLYPVANLFNNDWNIHSGDRYNLMAKAPWTQEKEKTFLNDPIYYLGQENFTKLYQIRDVIGLDFFGIDFTILDDGTLFIFELNAAMRHNFDHAKNFPYTQPHLERISLAFNNMVQERLQNRNNN